ncbi:hypothetical protein [Pseudomonas syringae]|uniref:Uncharacterized protein n=1 Tax=Pseudomonas syringae UB303 TaxID=1357287 RepID=A0AAJ4B4G5_PSESX|nr:hypothetical protein [Pseudomonas syringae]QHF10788.1 hypothetical protein N026_26485 [Pseudomonas syringae UB303]QQQ50459.1 hypothetical protein JJQ97_24655 [Pseudomonas syringae]
MKSELNKAIKEFLRYGAVEKMQNLEAVEILKKNKVIIPSEEINHDELMRKLYKEKSLAQKKDVVDSFLFGLENGQTDKRAALSAYAIMLNFPKHEFTSEYGINCQICGGFNSRTINFTLYNFMRYMIGSTNSGDPGQLYFFLREHNRAPKHSVESIATLKSILDVLRNATPHDTPLTMEKKIRTSLSIKITKEESRGLLDLLGQIGLLESDEHKGFLHDFKNIGLTPRKTRSSDWSYPIDFWKGEHGVNEEAVEFWFGDYLKRFN